MTPGQDGQDGQEALSAAYRDHWGPLVALLVGRFRRLDLAQDALAEAFVQATRHWPSAGVPANPAGWLHTAARRRALDVLRAEAIRDRKVALLVVDEEQRLDAAARSEARARQEVEDVLDPAHVRDEVLRLVFLCCHPALAPEARAALTLRLVLGLRTQQIARLFLVSEPTMTARLTRARRKLAAAGVALRLPGPQALDERVGSVVQVVYLAFTAGYAPGDGQDPVRVETAGEAIRLGRLLDELLPGRDDVRNLLALMVLQHSRRDARTRSDGTLVLLPDQDRGQWHHDEIAWAMALLAEGSTRPSTRTGVELRLEALVAAAHATAPTAADTDWAAVVGLYDELEQLTGSAVVRLNRAVALAEVSGPAAGLDLLDGLDDRLPRSHRLPAVRGELLLRSGERRSAAEQFALALERCDNTAERQHLRARQGLALSG